METPQHRTDSVQAPSESTEKEGSPEPESILSLHEPFRNLDDPTVIQESMQALSAATSRNFVVEFGDAHAHGAFDLDPVLFHTLLRSDRHDPLSTRWINIWYPFHQRSVLEILGQHYDFSPRLLALMCADPRRPSRRPDSNPYAVAAEQEHYLSDLESGSPCSSIRLQHLPDLTSSGSNKSIRTGNLYDIVDEVWHYSSIDQGRAYLCLGFNSLYSIGHITGSSLKEQTTGTDQTNQPLPHVKRVWTWLLLLSDRTVITITEDLFPYSSGYVTPLQQRILNETRSNLSNVFRSLSKVDMNWKDESPLTLLPIRRRLGDTSEETAHRTTDAPGLLFYYLFENWENSYSLVTSKESRYGIELQRVRNEMFKSPRLAHIDHLDKIGCQLAVLKRHYESYLRLVNRVVEPQKASVASLANNTRVASKDSRQSLSSPGLAAVPVHGTVFAMSTRTGQPVADVVAAGVGDDVTGMVQPEGLVGVSLSSPARVRFERSRDMIDLYALAECKDYLHQKESLVQMVMCILIGRSIDSLC